MFSGLATSQEHPARRWTALVSFTLQAALVSVAVVYPLLHPDSLPRVFHPLLVPVSSGAVPDRPQRTSASATGSVNLHPFVVNNHSISFGRATAPTQDAGMEAPDMMGVIGPSNVGVEHSI